MYQSKFASKLVLRFFAQLRYNTTVKAAHAMAAAIALVGWYLMTAPPPPNDGGKFDFDLSAPLSQWDIAGSYDRAAECMQALGEEIKPSTFRAMGMDAKMTQQQAYRYSRAARCISTDDPRLKGNQDNPANQLRTRWI